MRDWTDVSRVEAEDEYDSDEVPHDAVDLVPFALPHEEAELRFPQFGKGGEAETEEVGDKNCAE